MDHHLLDRFQSENKILIYLKASENNVQHKYNLCKIKLKNKTCLKRCPSSRLLKEAK